MQLLGFSGDTFESELVEFSKDKAYAPSLVANCNIEKVLEIYFGSELYKKLKNAILKCKKKVIVFEKLRKTTR